MKILNKRPIVLFAVVMIAMVLITLYHNSFILRVCLLWVFGALAIAGLVIWIVCKNKTCKYIFSRFFIVGLSVIISISTVFIHESLYNRDYSDFNDYAVVSGRVCEVGDYYNGNYRTIVLDETSVVTEEFEKDLNGKISLVIICDSINEDLFNIGTKVLASAKISFSTLYYVGDYGLSFNHAVNSITVSGYAMQASVEILSDELSLKLSDKIKNKITEIVENSLDDEYSSLALGMLFGDRLNIDKTISQDFSATGIAHLLAVSGLHVGFLLTILFGICKLCKIRGIVKFLIISSIIIFYAHLCGFSVSVVRASIMCICSLYAGCRFKRYDSINALAIAAILTTIINPFDLTTIGFRLSFMAVLSIILFSRPIAKILGKIFKGKMANTIATLFAVQIGTSGVIISAFKNISLVSIVANFISIPVASFAYMILFITVCISFIMPFANIIVYLYQFVMQIVVKFVHLLAPITMLSVSQLQGTVITYITIPAMYLSSNYLFINKKFKIVSCIILWLAVVIMLFI